MVKSSRSVVFIVVVDVVDVGVGRQSESDTKEMVVVNEEVVVMVEGGVMMTEAAETFSGLMYVSFFFPNVFIHLKRERVGRWVWRRQRYVNSSSSSFLNGFNSLAPALRLERRLLGVWMCVCGGG